MGRKINFTISFIDILTAIYCGFCVLELDTANYKYICLALLFSWFFVAYLSDRRALINVISHKIVWLLFLYALIYFFYVTFTRDVIYGIKYSFTVIIAESPFMLFLYYESKTKKSDFANILPWIEFIVIIYLCTNILKLIAADPNAARKMAAATNIYQSYVTGGGYQIAYALCLLVPFLLFTFRKYRYKLVVISIIATFVYTLIKCSYTIAILLAAFELFLLIYFSKKMSFHKKMTAIMWFMIIVALVCFFRDLIGDLFIEHISTWFSGSFVQRRMTEFGQFIKGEADDTNGATSRMELYGISIKTFFHSPIIGISYLTKFRSALEANLNGERYVGIHSTIFDGFARIGCSFVLYITYYWKAIRYTNRKISSNTVMIVGTVFFLMKMLNVADAFGLAYVVNFSIPMLCKSIDSKRDALEARDI